MRIARHMYVLASLWLASTAWAQMPFSLDTTFRTLITREYVNSLAVLEDGKVLLSGQIRFPGSFNNLGSARLLPNGQRDPSFGDFTGGGKLTAWSGGFYVGVGQSVKRLLPTGYNDPSFIGMNTGPYFNSLQGGDYYVYPEGRLLISGKHILDDTARGFVGDYNLIWFSNQGYLDTTRIHRKGNGSVYFFQELPDGKFICGGTCSQFESIPVDRIFRVSAAGIPDTTFQSDVYTGWSYTYVPLTDGRVYVGGNFRRNADPLDTLRLVRFMPDGSLDPSFNMPHFSLGGLENPLGPAIGKITPYVDGKLFVMGNFQYVNGEPRRGICVIDSTGTLTELFDECGVGVFNYQGQTNASLRGILPYGDDHWLIWGSYNGYSDGTTNDTLQRFVTRLHVGDITTGLAQQPALQWSVYPNPTSGVVALALDALPSNATVVVRDALGREVLRRTIADHYTTLDLQPLSDGIYSMELFSDHERIGTQRVVVQR